MVRLVAPVLLLVKGISERCERNATCALYICSAASSSSISLLIIRVRASAVCFTALWGSLQYTCIVYK